MQARPADRISLMDGAKVVDGKLWTARCFLRLADCADQRHCSAHDFGKVPRVKREAMFRKIMFRDVALFESRQRRRKRGCCDAATPRRAHRTPGGRGTDGDG